ncbi:uncharacterized protein LOC129779774 [Toxorhynchites rutilus septentrionalis]|uniref:uncharacterized protein LOC129779774 n=1 Tax=Toxorhynchites rutilus septentrionalis TaxID=329112 RepID=UPI002478D967|nr:uncharacterized protein LOC129779774 [Toxorhynchites rutilus septentrionalis]
MKAMCDARSSFELHVEWCCVRIHRHWTVHLVGMPPIRARVDQIKPAGDWAADTIPANYVRQLREYFAERANQNALYRAVCAADTGYSALHLAQAEYQLNCNLQTVEEKIAAWKQKAVHAAHPHQLDRPHVDKAASNLWLTRGELSSVVEADMIAIQDRIMPTRNCRRYVWHQDVDDICRMCHQPGENIEHIMGGCPVMANAAYTERQRGPYCSSTTGAPMCSTGRQRTKLPVPACTCPVK